MTIEAELQEITDEETREASLDAAVQYHMVREATPEVVVETAKVFEAYLRG